MNHRSDIPGTTVPPSQDGPGQDESEYTEEERTRDRAALIEELRAQVQSGEYKPSIGRISMNLVSNLAGD